MAATTTNSWGASPDDWDHFDLIIGLGSDLLPVVSNPNAEILPESKMKGLGKTPSLYNARGLVVGIAGWTAHQSSDQDIARWAKEGDYGICLQTRTVRALDIDVPDKDTSLAILGFVEDHLGVHLPLRQRGNTGKCLVAFTLPGELGKRKMILNGGVIEFLATGQQFVAVGTHPSGARYEWAGGLPYEFPELTLDEFETLWSALATRFEIEGGKQGGAVTPRKRGGRVAMADHVAEFLAEHGHVIGEDRDGALIIPCPWEAEHTTGERGDGSTVWFPAGTNGYGKGHFKCLHGHCDGRSDGDFFEAVGYVDGVASEFEIVVSGGHAEPLPLPPFKRDKKGGIEATIENVAMACRRSDVCGIEIRFDRFRDEIMFTVPGRGEWQSFADPDYSRLRIALEKRGFKPIGRELIRDVVLLVATENLFDSAQEWLSGLEWDGTPRVEQFLQRYFSADDTDYTRAVSVYLWTALAGRVMQPGVKADMVPILVGAQGVGKSTAVAAIAPAVEFFAEISFHEKDEDLARKMRGRLVGEIGELRGLHTKELETIKAFITRTHENWIPKYREFAVQFPRRLVFIGTTNKDEFLADETGNRRWLPVKVGAVDVEAIRADRMQLWAEARDRFVLLGVEFRQAETLAAGVHEQHMIKDTWAEIIIDWLDTADDLSSEKPRAREFLRVGDVLKGALRFDDKHIGRREEIRVGAILRTLGYERKKVRENGKTLWAFVPLRSPSVPLASDEKGNAESLV